MKYWICKSRKAAKSFPCSCGKMNLLLIGLLQIFDYFYLWKLFLLLSRSINWKIFHKINKEKRKRERERENKFWDKNLSILKIVYSIILCYGKQTILQLCTISFVLELENSFLRASTFCVCACVATPNVTRAKG